MIEFSFKTAEEQKSWHDAINLAVSNVPEEIPDKNEDEKNEIFKGKMIDHTKNNLISSVLIPRKSLNTSELMDVTSDSTEKIIEDDKPPVEDQKEETVQEILDAMTSLDDNICKLMDQKMNLLNKLINTNTNLSKELNACLLDVLRDGRHLVPSIDPALDAEQFDDDHNTDEKNDVCNGYETEMKHYKNNNDDVSEDVEKCPKRAETFSGFENKFIKQKRVPSCRPTSATLAKHNKPNVSTSSSFSSSSSSGRCNSNISSVSSLLETLKQLTTISLRLSTEVHRLQRSSDDGKQEPSSKTGKMFSSGSFGRRLSRPTLLFLDNNRKKFSIPELFKLSSPSSITPILEKPFPGLSAPEKPVNNDDDDDENNKPNESDGTDVIKDAEINKKRLLKSRSSSFCEGRRIPLLSKMRSSVLK